MAHRIRHIAVLWACLAAVLLTAGCVQPASPTSPGLPSGVEPGAPSQARPGVPSGAPSVTPTGDQTSTPSEDQSTVAAPRVVGLTVEAASRKIEAAGLKPVERWVHGPTEPGAKEPGVVYRQKPEAGARVLKGEKVTISSWWESG